MFRKAPFGLVLFAIFLPIPALADLTARDLVDIWRSADTVRVDLTTRQVTAGLMLSDVEIAMPGGAATIRADEVALTNRADGTVGIALASPPALIRGDISRPLDLTGADIVAARRGDGIAYTLNADEMAETLDAYLPSVPALGYAMRDVRMLIEAGGSPTAPLSLMFEAETAEIGFTARTEVGSQSPIRGAVSSGPIAGRFEFDGTKDFFASLLSTEIVMPNGTTDVSNIDISLDTATARGPVQIGIAVADVSIATAGNDRSLRIGTEANDMTVSVAAADFPPLDPAATVDALSYNLTLPVAPGVEAPLSLRVSLVDLAPSPGAWRLFDPQESLPRAPADLTLDLSAQATPTGPVFDAEKDMPFDISRLSIDDLDLSALGAQLSGRGAVADPFDPTAATGEIVLTASGLLDLIDALSETGLLPPQQELGARFGLSFATVPDAETDGLRSTITFENGAITLNDQAMRR